MKKIGCLVVVLGLLFVLGSCAVFGGMIKKTFESQEIKSFPIELNKPHISEVINVDTNKTCQLKLTVDVASKSTKKEKTSGYALQYHFPVKYKILDEHDNIIFIRNTAATCREGLRLTLNEKVSSSGGYATIKHSFEKFSIPSHGKIKIKVEVEPDTTYNATANSVILSVYDNVPRYASSFFRGIMMSFIGPILILIGIIIFIFGLVLHQ